MDFLRTLVSGNRQRLIIETAGSAPNVNLDLSYITPRLIAMSYPASSLVEACYRNSLADVAAFLDSRHREAYLVLNLSERPYDVQRFGHRVVELGFPDHHAPPVEVAWTLCLTMHAWLQAAPDHVSVVHCLAGKGRTGVVICAYMLFSGLFFETPPVVTSAPSYFSLPPPVALASAALAAFQAARGEGVTYSSQKRIVTYFARVVHAAIIAEHERLEAADRLASAATALTPDAVMVDEVVPPAVEATRIDVEGVTSFRADASATPSTPDSVVYLKIDSSDATSAMSAVAGASLNTTVAVSASGLMRAPSSSRAPAPLPMLDAIDLSVSARGGAAENKSMRVRWDAALRVRSLRSLPLPKAVAVSLQRVIVAGLPPSAFLSGTPVLLITTTPYQGAETRILYDSAVAAAAAAAATSSTGETSPSGGRLNDETHVMGADGGPPTVAIFDHTHVTLEGDIFLRVLTAGGTSMLHASLHSAFLPVGVLRLNRTEVDRKSRARASFPLAPDFRLDLIYSVATAPATAVEGKKSLMPSGAVNGSVAATLSKEDFEDD